jgi:hypothetical protein
MALKTCNHSTQLITGAHTVELAEANTSMSHHSSCPGTTHHLKHAMPALEDILQVAPLAAREHGEQELVGTVRSHAGQLQG